MVSDSSKMAGMMKSHHNEEKIDGQREIMGKWEMKGKRLEHIDALEPIDGEMNKMHDMGKWDVKGKRPKQNDPLEPIDWQMKGKKLEHDAGEWEKTGDMEKWEMKGEGRRLEPDGDGDGDDDDMGKWEIKGKGVEQVDAARDDELGTELYDMPNPETYPGADAGFHFNLGPIGFGFEGGLQWGGNPSPLYVVPYSQPYVVVSPYSVPYTPSPPDPYPTPYQQPGSGYQQPGSGYQQPGSGYGMPQSGHDGPYPSPGGYAQDPYQKGWGSGSTPSN